MNNRQIIQFILKFLWSDYFLAFFLRTGIEFAEQVFLHETTASRPLFFNFFFKNRIAYPIYYLLLFFLAI